MPQLTTPPAPLKLLRSGSLRLMVVLMLLTPLFVGLGPSGPISAQEVPELRVNSNRYVVTDSETGEIYAQRNSDERVAIGSLTKIFTVIEALEIAPLDTVVTTDESDLKDPANNSLMGFATGEELTLEELLYGLMLPSGNDAAHAVARSLGFREGDTDPQQSVDRYMGWINQRVLDMGLVNTHLITPDGWGVPGHYTTAHDLAAFTRYAMTYPFFRTLISSAEYTTAAGNAIYNNNRLLGLYPDLVGGKTGYDWDAGWCLVEVAERDGMQMVSVTLDGVHENMDWYDDNEVLLDYGFEQRTAQKQASQAWSGSTALFSDPDVAVLDRTTTATGQLGGESAAVAVTAPGPAANQTADVAGTTTGTTSGTDPVADTGTTGGAAAADPAAQSQTTDLANSDGGGGGTGTTIARIALVFGLLGLIVLAAGLLYTRLKPRRRLTTGSLRSPSAAQAAERPSTSSTSAAVRPTSAAARTAQRRPIPPRR